MAAIESDPLWTSGMDVAIHGGFRAVCHDGLG